MRIRFLSALTLFVSLVMTGCAGFKPMAFSKDDPSPTPDTAVLLLSVTVKNVYRESFQPDLLSVRVDGGATSDEKQVFKTDDQGAAVTNSMDKGNSYLIRIPVKPGAYTIRLMGAMKHRFPVVPYYQIPVHAPVKVEQAGVYYLGRVEATLRERKGNEFRAGSVVPLIDQAAGGASGGTFDVVISDQWADDEGKFLDAFPALKAANIRKSILPPFNRDEAQKWWEKN